MIDGATDSSVSENEVIHACVIEDGTPRNKMLDLKELEHAHAEMELCQALRVHC